MRREGLRRVAPPLSPPRAGVPEVCARRPHLHVGDNRAVARPRPGRELRGRAPRQRAAAASSIASPPPPRALKEPYGKVRLLFPAELPPGLESNHDRVGRWSHVHCCYRGRVWGAPAKPPPETPLPPRGEGKSQAGFLQKPSPQEKMLLKISCSSPILHKHR